MADANSGRGRKRSRRATMTRVENDTAAQPSGPPNARRDHSGPPRGLTESGLDSPDRTICQPNVAVMVTALLTLGSALRLTGVRTSPALVTVITPAYNVGPWIGEAIDSVRCQTERRFEYIVVDDGCTDDTADGVRARAAEDDRIRLVSMTNSGSGAARTAGLAPARPPRRRPRAGRGGRPDTAGQHHQLRFRGGPQRRAGPGERPVRGVPRRRRPVGPGFPALPAHRDAGSAAGGRRGFLPHPGDDGDRERGGAALA